MKTKLLRKIRKMCLMKYTFNDNKYHKELVLYIFKHNEIRKNRYEPMFSHPDLAFVLDELKQTKLLKQYWAKRAYKQFKKI